MKARMKEESKPKIKHTNDESVGDSKEELVEEREDIIVDKGVTVRSPVCHYRDGEEEEDSAEEKIQIGLVVEGPFDISNVLPHCVPDVIHSQKYQTAPSGVQVRERF